jgi:hypothetical protein
MKGGDKKERRSTFSNHQILKFNLLVINFFNFLLTIVLNNSENHCTKKRKIYSNLININGLQLFHQALITVSNILSQFLIINDIGQTYF